MAGGMTSNTTIPNLPKKIEGLSKIAINLWWTWNVQAKELFKLANPYMWKESTHNPIKLLKSLNKKQLEDLSKDESFLSEYNYVYALFKGYMESSAKLCPCIPEKPLPIAYFCAEYGLHHSIPIYSGGLGFLAGDIMKESSDMALPMVGIGFMYSQGYVQQVMGSDGWQTALHKSLDRDAAPIERVIVNGKQMILEVPFIHPKVYVAVWKVNIGRVTLYLLDTDIKENEPWDRELSYRLYTTNVTQRLRQQIVLGFGGQKVLEKIGIKYSIMHLNEGYPAFALLERVRANIKSGMDFNSAVESVRNSSIFTTHTPLQAATDVYSFDLIGQYFCDYCDDIGVGTDELMRFGVNPDHPSDGFNTTVFAFNLTKYHNAVSKKHQQVTKKIWSSLFNDLPEDKIPIDYVTNGIHLATWQSDELSLQLDGLLGNSWRQIRDDKHIWEKLGDLDDKTIWQIHRNSKMRLINFIREIVRRKWSEQSIDPSIAMAEGVMLDPDILTICYARRFTAYKRPDLILHDIDRFANIINNPSKPVQVIFAGKAHPADTQGKKILQHVFRVAQDSRFKGRIAFIENYGEFTAKRLLQGVDVWLNNPRIPLEASGTSGMKAAANGTLNLAILDGWWPESFNGKNGWAFGDPDNWDGNSDDADADSIYKLLEDKIVPLYYDVEKDDLPHKWIKMMRETIKTVSPAFSAVRMMKEYLDKFYLPISRDIRFSSK